MVTALDPMRLDFILTAASGLAEPSSLKRIAISEQNQAPFMNPGCRAHYGDVNLHIYVRKVGSASRKILHYPIDRHMDFFSLRGLPPTAPLLV
jgi:hypothetical protein